ncbi:MAG TPA: class I SAM-dependent methyltransferase, partial [Vicinamibacteria bacterium]|nr:class I SAM-dependent methyltransferase [Vicinamibacteria bacterium]
MLDRLRRRQTLASFDHQWGCLREGDAMLSDPWFRENVDRVIVEELLCVERDWFHGKTVLDAGCGIGRWTLGLLRLGCRVLAVDASTHALEAVHAGLRELAPDAVAEGRLETRQVDLLDLPPDIRERRFDLVFSFGVLHHTG